jgi:hypothetical protein
MKYSVNGGEKIIVTASTDIEHLNVGDKVQFYGNGTKTQMYGNQQSTGALVKLAGGSAKVKAYGNIMSLVDETGFATTTLPLQERAFYSLFKDNKNLIDASDLLLPATTLAPNCYERMFVICDNLTAAPALPATTLAEGCYNAMFEGCTSLATAPALPAKTLASNCYDYMFKGCTSLTTAPALPATTLADRCYDSMINGCTNLSSVTCLATDISALDCTDNWLSGVAATGTFTKASSMTSWASGADGIPEGWTVEDAKWPPELQTPPPAPPLEGRGEARRRAIPRG